MAYEARDPEPTRRGFLNWFLGTGTGAFLFSMLYPQYLVNAREDRIVVSKSA